MPIINLFRRKSDERPDIEPYEPPAEPEVIEAEPEMIDAEPLDPREARNAARRAARAATRERYLLIAECLKREVGIRRHYRHRENSGLAWLVERKILAPEGFTLRQLYVLAHECGHIALHTEMHTWTMAGHVKEHEAETYAHRAFSRYGLRVPAEATSWARDYVGLWIMKDRAAKLAICPMANDFAKGKRSPHDYLAAVDNRRGNDFSKHVERFIQRANETAAKQDNMLVPIDTGQRQPTTQQGPPNACGTCKYVGPPRDWNRQHWCSAYLYDVDVARFDPRFCNNGIGWRPKREGLFQRFRDRFFG